MKESVRSEKCVSVKFEVWSAKSTVCSVRCGVSREGYGRDKVSLNHRSFMFGKHPPPACPGLCYARIAALRVLGPSSAWFRIALASMSRVSSSGNCGGSAVGEDAAGSWVSCSGGSFVRARSVGMSIRVVLSSHQRSKCQVGALPLDWVRIAAEFDRCAHDTGRKADRHTWVKMSGRLHMQK